MLIELTYNCQDRAGSAVLNSNFIDIGTIGEAMSDSLPKQSKPEMKKAYHHGNLRAAIFAAVAQIIGDSRSLSFHLKEVAKLVGTSPPAIYKHFENKNALLLEMAVEGYELQKRFRNQAIKDSGGSPLADLLAIGTAYVDFAMAHPGYFLLMKNLETKEMLSSKRYMTERKSTVSLVLGLIQQCIDDEVIADVDPRFAMVLLQSTAYGLAQLYITGQIDPIAEENASDPLLTLRVFAQTVSSLLTEQGLVDLRSLQSTWAKGAAAIQISAE